MHPPIDGCIMVDITPERRLKDMKKILTKEERGEIEFQVGFYTATIYTGMVAKVMRHDNDHIDILLIQHHEEYASLMYIANCVSTPDGIKIDCVSAVRGKNDEDSMMEITFAIERGLDKFNYWGN